MAGSFILVTFRFRSSRDRVLPTRTRRPTTPGAPLRPNSTTRNGGRWTCRTTGLSKDRSIESENPTQGYRPSGIGWYRRHFKLDKSDQGKHLELQFDGVATHCVVWVNGILVHRNWCGYNSFTIDVTPFPKYGDNVNTIAVRVDANAMEGWWYEGAGIYRHTWLVKRDPVHIATDGVYANPVRDDDRSWTIPIEVTLASCATAAGRNGRDCDPARSCRSGSCSVSFADDGRSARRRRRALIHVPGVCRSFGR